MEDYTKLEDNGDVELANFNDGPPKPTESTDSVDDAITGVVGSIRNKFGDCGMYALAIAITAVFMMLPLTMITIGSIYLHQCPLEPVIPVYLIVHGVLLVITGGICTQFGLSYLDLKHRCPSCCLFFISTFSLVWFLAGSFFVFSNFEKVNLTNKNSPQYCHPVCFYGSFALMMFVYVMVIPAYCFWLVRRSLKSFQQSEFIDASSSDTSK